MADEQSGADAPSGQPATQEQKPDGAPKQAEEWRNKDEIVKAIKDSREAKKVGLEVAAKLDQVLSYLQPKTESPSTEEPKGRVRAADAMDEVTKLRQELAFKDAIDDVDVPLTKGQKSHLKRLYNAERPTDVADWLGSAIDELGLRAVKQDSKPVESPTEPAPKIPNSPQPGLDRKSHLPDDIMKLPPGVTKGMAPNDLKNMWKKYLTQTGDDGNEHVLSKRSKPLMPK